MKMVHCFGAINSLKGCSMGSVPQVRQFADKLLTDRDTQAALSKHMQTAVLELARVSGIQTTPSELAQAYAEAVMEHSKAATAAKATTAGRSYFQNMGVSSNYYVTVQDLAANPPIGALEDFLVQLRGGSTWDRFAVTWMYGDPENAAMVVQVAQIANSRSSGVFICNPIALPAWATPWNP
jgi:hypothetical protein